MAISVYRPSRPLAQGSTRPCNSLGRLLWRNCANTSRTSRDGVEATPDQFPFQLSVSSRNHFSPCLWRSEEKSLETWAQERKLGPQDKTHPRGRLENSSWRLEAARRLRAGRGLLRQALGHCEQGGTIWGKAEEGGVWLQLICAGNFTSQEREAAPC